MILGKVGNQVFEDFTVADPTDNSLVSGLVNGDFTSDLFTPSGASSPITVTISELGSGNYRAIFTPNTVGTWYLIVHHTNYFPWGKAGNIQVFANDFDTIGDMLIRALGLMQENYYIDETEFNALNLMTHSRVRIYNNSVNVGSGTGVIATYLMDATYEVGGKLIDYQVVKQ